MRSLTGSLADCVLVDAILISPRLPILPTSTAHQYQEGKGIVKRSTETRSTKTIKKNVGMAKSFSTKYVNKGLAFNYSAPAIQMKLCQDA